MERENNTNIPYIHAPYEAEIAYFIALGAHSEIPTCCIHFWLMSFRDASTEDIQKYWTYFPREVGYIPCPECIKNKNFIKIHLCDKNNEVCKRYLNPKIFKK